MSDILKRACEVCVADKGKEDDILVQRLYDYIHEHFEEKGKPWDYELIDSLIDTWKNEVEFRELDGVYFRVKRNNKWQNICFSDMTEDEMREVINGRDKQWLEELCIILGKTLRKMGDMFNIVPAKEKEDE